MVMVTPAVSVVMPLRDAATFLDEAMASLLGQTFADLEVLAIDDGSRDATGAILAGWAIVDARVRALRNPGRGLVTALNFGLAEARAPLVARMDGDDIARPERIGRQVAFLDAHPDVVAVGTQIAAFGAGLARSRLSRFPCPPEAVRVAMMQRCCLAHPSVVLRRKAVIDAGGYRDPFRHAEDYDLWLRLLERGELANLDWPGLDYRLHGGMASLGNAEAQELEALAARRLALLRQAGEAEPDLGPGPVGRETLMRLGINARTIARHVRRAWFNAARNAQRAADPGARRRCLAEAGPWRLPGGGVGDVADYAWRWLKVRT